MKSTDFSRAASALLALALLLCVSAPAAWAGHRKVQRKVAPEYPELARRMNIRGTVWVETEVSPDGKVTKAHVIRGNDLLAPAAKEAVKKWKFAPEHNASREKVKIEFKLTDELVEQESASRLAAAWLPVPR